MSAQAAIIVGALSLAQIQGPATAEPARLVVLTASPADQSAWFVVGDGVDLVQAEDGSRAYLVSRRAGAVSILLFQARAGDGRLAVSKYLHEVRFEAAGPGPQPGPQPNPGPVDRFGAGVRDASATLSSDERAAVARNYREGAAAISRAVALADPSPWKTLAGIQGEMRALNRRLPATAELTRFFEVLAGLVRAENPADPGEVAQLWLRLAEALGGVK